MNIQKKRIAKFAICAIAAAVVLYLVYVYTWAASCAFLMADDFSHANDIGVKYTGIFSAFGAAFRYMGEVFMTWQGTYFSMFLQALLSPLNGAGAGQLQIVMVCNILFLFGSIFVLICAISKWALDRIVWHYVLPVYGALLFSINAFQVWTEVYYWYSGAISYSIPFSFTCFAVAGFLMSDKCEKKKSARAYAIASAVCMLLACGGSLQVAGTTCYVILIMAFMDVWKTHKISLAKWGIFLCGLAGALINTAAPGNYVRYASGGDSKLHVFRAVSGVLLKIKEEADWMMNELPFVAVLLLMIAIGIFAGKYTSFKMLDMFLFGAALIMTPLVNLFPVVLAYDASYFPNRCKFLLDVVMMGIYLFVALMIGCMLHELFQSEREKLQLTVICVMLAVVSFSSNETYDVEDLNIITTEIALDSGAIQNYSDSCKAIYDYIENSAEMDVVIPELPLTLPTYTKLMLTDDPAFWINVNLAEYFGKNSIRAIYTYQE